MSLPQAHSLSRLPFYHKCFLFLVYMLVQYNAVLPEASGRLSNFRPFVHHIPTFIVCTLGGQSRLSI